MGPFWIKIVLSFLLTFFNSPAFSSEKRKSDEFIIIVKNDWSSQIVLSHILKEVLVQLDYKIRFTKLKTDEQWAHLLRGWAHIQVEVWEGTMGEMFNKFVNSGQVLDAGTHDAVTREEWWYPYYVKEKCPGLPNWTALKNCSHLFSKDKVGKKGLYLGGPWEKPDKARIRALGLNFEVQRVKDGRELWLELEKAYKRARLTA